jgi:uncharacterized Zn-binding protein involved in type VI secretion
MSGIATELHLSTGHDGFPPTLPQGPYTTKSYINGVRIQLKNVTMYKPHTKGVVTHHDAERLVIGGSSKFYLEGIQVARIGDRLADGDAIAEGSEDSFIGG